MPDELDDVDPIDDLDDELTPLEDDELPPEDDDQDDPVEDEDPPSQDDDEPSEDDDQEGRQDSRDQGQRGEGRADRRIQNLSRQLREVQAELTRSRQTQTGQTPDDRRRLEEAQAAERERFAHMTPEEQNRYLLDQQQRSFDQRFNQLQFQLADDSDRRAFDDLSRRSPTAQKLAAKVEQELTKLRNQGQNVPRRTILAVLIGERALTGAPRAQSRQQRRADDQRQRQTARPGKGSRSDVSPQDRRATDDREARRRRLEDESF